MAIQLYSIIHANLNESQLLDTKTSPNETKHVHRPILDSVQKARMNDAPSILLTSCTHQPAHHALRWREEKHTHTP